MSFDLIDASLSGEVPESEPSGSVTPVNAPADEVTRSNEHYAGMTRCNDHFSVEGIRRNEPPPAPTPLTPLASTTPTVFRDFNVPQCGGIYSSFRIYLGGAAFLNDKNEFMVPKGASLPLQRLRVIFVPLAILLLLSS